MGEAVSILELAKDMIRLSGLQPGRDIAIEIVGRRPGEKLHEELFAADEHSQPTAAEKIVRAVRRAPLDPEWVDNAVRKLEELVREGDESQVAEQTVRVVADRRRSSAAGAALDIDSPT
jgi:FlaA1/EpsC-like NDP-sugar epimerase